MSERRSSPVETSEVAKKGTPAPELQQPPDTKERAIEHGAETFYREQGAPSDGQPPEAPDAERKASEKLPRNA